MKATRACPARIRCVTIATAPAWLSTLSTWYAGFFTALLSSTTGSSLGRLARRKAASTRPDRISRPSTRPCIERTAAAASSTPSWELETSRCRPRARGLHLLVSSSHDGVEEAAAAVRSMQGRVDGLLILSGRVDAAFLRANLPRELPVVLLNSAVKNPAYHVLNVDNHAGAVAMV